jgi:Flp pilus assembly protein TadG
MKRRERGSTALEFAFVITPFLLLVFGGMEYARMLWTWQALQSAGDQTARCVAIGSLDCPSASQTTYAVNAAKNYGASALVASGVRIVNPSTGTPCNPATGNTDVAVTLTMSFTSPAGTLIPGLTRTLTTVSCYPLTGH